MELCDCGAPIAVSNCAFEGCLACWEAYQEEMLAIERGWNMERTDLAVIIAEYLNDRDDIASATASGSQVVVETQGGTAFAVEVGPSLEV